MKSLQVLTPNKKCIFNCPFCISKSHKHNNTFVNNYENNYKLWESNFIKVLKENKDLKNIVITGTNEPMQDEKCVDDIINITRKYRSDINIELQTRYYKESKVFSKLDVVAFSVSDFRLLKIIKKTNNVTRIVIILTDSFNSKSLKDIIYEMDKNIEQLTFKVLHDSNGFNVDMDNWIKKHKTDKITIENLKKDIDNYNGNISIIFDETCMDSTNRYMVYREDGNLYKDFEEVSLWKI